MSDIDLYHVACFSYTPGQIFKADKESFYAIGKKNKNENWVNELLNAHKPLNAPLREYTFYAFDCIGNCHAFITSQPCISGNPMYYKVRMINPAKAPMCLTDLILKEGVGSSKLTAIVNEYWTPTKGWKYFEYLSNEMKILEILPAPQLIDRIEGKSNYQFDFDLKSNL